MALLARADQEKAHPGTVSATKLIYRCHAVQIEKNSFPDRIGTVVSFS